MQGAQPSDLMGRTVFVLSHSAFGAYRPHRCPLSILTAIVCVEKAVSGIKSGGPLRDRGIGDQTNDPTKVQANSYLKDSMATLSGLTRTMLRL